MNRPRLSIIGHGDLPLWNPVSPEVFESWFDGLPLTRESSVLDVGCGRAQLLERLVDRFGCRGVGVDTNEAIITEATERTGGRLDLRCEPFDAAAFSAGQFDLTACIGSTHAIGDLAEAIRVLRDLTRQAGFLLLAEGYWQQPPASGYLEFLGCSQDAYLTHDGNRDLARRLGLEVVASHASTTGEWSRYEDTYYANVTRFGREHPEDRDAAAFLTHIERWREAYLKWGRNTLGFGLYLLRRP